MFDNHKYLTVYCSFQCRKEFLLFATTRFSEQESLKIAIYFIYRTGKTLMENAEALVAATS